MKSTIALISLAGAAVASPLRGNVMSPRFAEVGVDGSLFDAYTACKLDQLAKGAGENAMDAACALVPGCETIRQGKATAETMAGLVAKAEADPNFPALKALIEKEGTVALAQVGDEANFVKGGLSKLGKTLQALSPKLMRQCLACVLGSPKGAFGEMLKMAQASEFDGWEVAGDVAQDVCTIGLGSLFLVKSAHPIPIGTSGKKAILMDAYVDTMAGSARYKSDVKMSLEAGIKKAEIKQSMSECEVETEMIFSSFSKEVIDARKFWNTASWTGKAKDCKLKNEATAGPENFKGEAWVGC